MIKVIDLKLEIWFDKDNVFENVIFESDLLSTMEVHLS